MKDYIITKPQFFDFIQIKKLGIRYLTLCPTSYIPFFQLIKTSLLSKETLVAKVDNKVIGYVYTFNLFSKNAFIQQCCVDPKYRNKNIGTNLLKRMLSVLNSRGYKKVRLRTGVNNKMIKICKKLGFIEIKKVFFNTKCLMEKEFKT